MPGKEFEEQVRVLARAKWSLASGEGGARFINGQEIDCVCETEDLMHLIMCTVSQQISKLKADVDKLGKAGRYLGVQGHLAKLWEITLNEPTADQREIARKGSVTLMSISEFRRSLIDVTEYFNCRKAYRFGSAIDPVSNSQKMQDEEYIPLPIGHIQTGAEESVRSLARRLEDRSVCTLVGEFGAGKSFTSREAFFELSRRYFSAGKLILPIAINLREHWGQTSVAEVLIRHAQNIAYPKPNDLVRAWNTGNCIVILDGFDELTIQSFVNHPRTKRMARQAATQIIREFVAAARGHGGVLITGRGHYFDSYDELRSALGLTSTDPILELGAFTDENAREYLRNRDVPTELPEWLPRTPLLLGYLAARRLLADIAELGTIEDPAEAWDQFLDKISVRDAALSTDIDPSTVRRLLERLATRTRLSVGGAKPLDDGDIGTAFREVTGMSAFDSTHSLLQRLPGLTARMSEEGARSFVDNEMLEALRASDVRHYLVNPYTEFVNSTIQHPLTAFGCEVLAHLSAKNSLSLHQHVSAAREAINRWNEGTLALDCLVAGGLRAYPEPLSCGSLNVSDGYIDVMDLEEIALDGLHLNGCGITLLRLGTTIAYDLELHDCLFGRVEGVTSATGLPSWIHGADVNTFDDAVTNAALLDLSVPLPLRVALTVLKKVYLQSGSGRRDGALRRGLDVHARGYVDSILEILRRHAFVWSANHSGSTVWHRNPDMRARVKRIVASPLASGDPMIPEIVALEQ